MWLPSILDQVSRSYLVPDRAVILLTDNTAHLYSVFLPYSSARLSGRDSAPCHGFTLLPIWIWLAAAQNLDLASSCPGPMQKLASIYLQISVSLEVLQRFWPNTTTISQSSVAVWVLVQRAAAPSWHGAVQHSGVAGVTLVSPSLGKCLIHTYFYKTEQHKSWDQELHCRYLWRAATTAPLK